MIGCRVAVPRSHWSAACLLHLPVVEGLIFCISATPNLGTSFPLFHAAPPHLAAHPAGVGLDAGVEPHVPGQHVAPREAPLAHVAEVGLAYRTCRVDILDITGMVEREMLNFLIALFQKLLEFHLASSSCY